MTLQYTIEDIINEKLHDAKGKPCPARLKKKLKEAGLVQISISENHLVWKTLAKDVDRIVARTGKVLKNSEKSQKK